MPWRPWQHHPDAVMVSPHTWSLPHGAVAEVFHIFSLNTKMSSPKELLQVTGDESEKELKEEIADEVDEKPKAEQLKGEDEEYTDQKVESEEEESDEEESDEEESEEEESEEEVLETTPQMSDASVIKYSVKTTPYLQR